MVTEMVPQQKTSQIEGGGGRKLSFTGSMALFVTNKENKQMFIDMLGERLE